MKKQVILLLTVCTVLFSVSPGLSSTDFIIATDPHLGDID